MFVPLIMHHLENALLIDHLCNGLLAPIRFASLAVVYPTLCTPAASEDGGYRLLEFLGDTVFEMLTSTELRADH